MKTKKKRGVEVPPKVRAFINNVTSAPLENMVFPLSSFKWDYEKGDFNHWVDLLNHFDLFFEKYIKPRKDLQLEGDFFDAESTFPKEAVLQILRVTRIILENCVNKHCYSSYEHLSSLLASTDADVVAESLHTLAAFVKKPVQSARAVRWHGDAGLNARLFSLSQGWGGKEEGLGLLACAIENGCDSEAQRLGSTLHFEFYSSGSLHGENMEDNLQTFGLKVIHMPELYMRCETDLQLLKQLIDQYNVPASLRFSLLTRLRFARSFPVLSIRRIYLCIRLLAFTVLLQSNPDPEDLTAFFINEPEFVNELVTLIRCEDIVPEDIRILSILALAALSQDRSRQSSVLSAISAGGHRGILPSLMQKAAGSMMNGASNCSVFFMEALLSLVTVLVSSSSGCAALREAGLIPTLLPLLKDLNPQHTHLVSSAVHILEAFMDYSNPAGTLFRDLGGLDDAIARLKLEVSRVEEGADKRQEELQYLAKGKMPVKDAEAQHTMVVQPEALIPFQQRLLLKALLRAIALGTYAPGNAARLHGSEESSLPACLCTIFKHAKEFGGGVFSLAASVMSDLIHKDPTCYSALNAAGLPAAFLTAVTSGVLPSSEAVSCIPHSLDALCLNNAGLGSIKECNALSCFIRIFTSKLYLRALANETPGSLASGLDELMRHAPSLRGPGVDTCIAILKRIAVIGGCAAGASVSFLENTVDPPVPMDTDLEVKTVDLLAREDHFKAEANQATESDNLNANVETLLPEYINNTARLLETILQNTETSRVFIEKKGIESLLQLYTLPSLPLSFGGSSVAHNLSLTFRAFSPQHSTALSRSVCGVLRDHLKMTVEAVSLLQNSKLSDLESDNQNKLIRCLSATECFLALTSVLVRSTNAMMTELSVGEADVLSNIGKLHREVLWQISLLDDAKVDTKEECDPGNSTAATTQAVGSREGDDDARVIPVRYVNPISIHNGSTLHWSVEPSHLPVIHTGEGLHRRRREPGGTAEVLTQIARLGRLAHRAEAAQDSEGCLHLAGGSHVQETKRKSPECINYEVMARFVSAARGLYVALGKAMVVPSRRRDDIVSPSSTAKAVAAALAKLLHDNLNLTRGFELEVPTSVKCRYLGKVVEDITAVVFDNRRRTCNTLMVNNLYVCGAFAQLLVTLDVTTQLLWRVLQPTILPMESESGQVESEKADNNLENNTWLLETLKNYAKLMENLVTSSLLLIPPSMSQLLVQQNAGGSVHIPRDPEVFVRTIQAQVLEVILPIWNHPLFPSCIPSFISSLAAILTHIYSGIVDTKGQRNGGPGTRFFGPPPDESSIATIVEMGFSRARAEEALRRVETNSVEMAMEWLFSHPEEPREDDELARALALSLGSSDAPSEDIARKESEASAVEEKLKALPVEDMLTTCMNLLQRSDTVAFPLTDLLVTVCNHNKGHDRPRVISYLIYQLKQAQIEQPVRDTGPLSILSHTLALILNEDSTGREIAAENGIVNIALDILSGFDPCKVSEVHVAFPKWVTTLLLVLDHMLQYKPKINQKSGVPANSAASAGSDPVATDKKLDMEVDNKECDGKPFTAVLGKSTGYMIDDEPCRAMKVACNLLQAELQAATAQAVLQLCARLTKTHSLALQFLESGGLTAILSLPRQCLFPGFDSVAAAIIRHLLEDPQTLQQAMESEIRHTLMAMLQRHSGRVSTRMFLTAMSPVVSRDPHIFMQAAAAVCQIENMGGRSNVTLLKEKEREKERDDKDKEKLKSCTIICHGEAGPCTASTDTSSKGPDALSKPLKGHHKKVPQSFSQVIDQLLEVILHFPPPVKDGNDSSSLFPTAMEVDEVASKEKGKAKVEECFPSRHNHHSETSADLAKVAFILKLMTEIILMYSSAAGVVLRRDSESSQGRGPSQGGSEMVGHGGLLYHILHRLLPYPVDKASEKLSENDWREKLSDKAAYFLMAICIRSGEGRRRVVAEVSRAMLHAANISDKSAGKRMQPPSRKVHAFVDLVNLILSAHSSSSNAQLPGFSTDMAKTMIDAGLVQSLTKILQVIDLDHPEAPKLVNSLLKALEALTRAASIGDQVYGGGSSQKKVTQGDTRPADGSVPATDEQPLVGSQGLIPSQTGDQRIGNSVLVEIGMVEGSISEAHVDGINRTNQMEHGLRLGADGADRAHLEAEAEELMHDASGDRIRLGENGAGELAFRVEHRGVEEDEEMDGDDGDDDGDEEEEEEDDEDEDDMEGAEGVTHLSPPDTDVEDHEDNGLGDEFGEDMVEEEDEEDDWQEGRVIEVQWRDGLTGLNHLQVLGHPGPGALVDFTGDPFQGMNIDDIFSSFRRPAVVDRRRPTGYRSFTERPVGDLVGPFHHPLLTRPSPSPAVGSMAGIPNNGLWAATSSITRDAEALLGGGFDVSHFYMYDGPGLAEHSGDALFGERGVGGLPQPLLDFSMAPVYLMGRRGGRTDGRLSSWTDDGQPQAGAHAAAVAQAIEEQFISCLQSHVSSEEPLPSEQVSIPANSEHAQQTHCAINMEGAEPDAAVRMIENEQQDMDTQRSEGQEMVQNTDLPRNVSSAQVGACEADVQMHEERSGPVLRDAERCSQDSGGSAATVGESLRSLEVEIGSADGCDDNDRQTDTERLISVEIPYVSEDSHRHIDVNRREEQGDADEEMLNQPIVDAATVTICDRLGQEGAEVPASENPGRTGDTNNSASAIDPTFLDALPDDLRAEVLASQQTQTTRAASLPPSAVEAPAEDIDPEFLAALPPDIQAEVLAQQRAQRLIQSHQAEGHPVDMDSASIIATFPAELREEVLLTSSEQDLAALPPSLLAEAQLLRERAMNQFRTRGIFGGAHRIGGRRNNFGVGVGTSSVVERGVGSGTMGRRPGAVGNSSIRVKEVEGKPLVDTSALKAMLQLLRLAQPLGKGLLQRLLLNLCAHSATRVTLVILLLDMLRPEVERSSASTFSDGNSSAQRLYGCQWNVVYARSQLADGVPPLVSRRVLEILTYLSRNHPLVARLLFYLEPTGYGSDSYPKSSDIEKEKGKGKLLDDAAIAEVSEQPKGEVPLVLLLKLLNQPLYARSSAHLEQVMGLLEVVTSNVESKHTQSEPTGLSKVTLERVVNDSGLSSLPVSSSQGVPSSEQNQSMDAGNDGGVEPSRASAQTGGNADIEGLEPETSGQKMDPALVLLNLPEPELQHLCRLLAREGLSDVAYNRVAEVIKKLAHVAPAHRRLFISELADAARSLSTAAVSELTSLGGKESVVLSASSMAGAATLRVLQCLGVLSSSEGSLTEKENESSLEREQEEGLAIVRSLNIALEPLWQGLSMCISKIENKLGGTSMFTSGPSTAAVSNGVSSPLPPGTQRILPFIEAFFVLCEKLRIGSSAVHMEPSTATAREIKEAASSSHSAALPVSKPFLLTQKRLEGDTTFVRFAEKHRRMLNAFIRQNPGLLEKSFSLLLKTPRLIDFDNKRAFFRTRIRQQHEQQHYAPLRVPVRRAYVLEDSYNQLRMRTPEEMKGRLTVQFQGEEGIDAGGLTREWYQVLSRVIFDKGALLFTTVGNESSFQPNPNSVYQTEHLSYFKFVGRVVGKALFDGQLLDVYFTRSFYKHILGVKVTYHDIEAVDPDYYKNLKWVLENDVSSVDYLFFSVDASEETRILYEKNEVTDIELVPGGRNMRVTEENKHEYVDLIAEHKLTTAIRPQINAFLEGFNELIHRDLVAIFHDKELELLISGLPEIDLDDMKANTEYTGYTAASPVVQWYWEVVWTFSKEDLARLLQFITGTSKVPLDGFRALQGISGPQKFQIHKAYGAPERLPSAHTCFNQLDLPEYSSKEQLEERLLLAIHEASEGFGFG